MTWLDLVGLITLGGVAVGGYTQGFVRGVLRILSILGGGALSALFMLRVKPSDDLQQMLMWTAGAALLGMLVTSLFTWSITRAIPPFIHESFINRVLGVLPAMLIALIVLTVALGLADRLAITDEQRVFLRGGLLTGPLIAITDWLEHLFVVIR